MNHYSGSLESCEQKFALPKVSVITVVFNGETTIERTIKSVVSQTYPNLEYLIVDGGSSDGTNAVVQKYIDKISAFISEPDKGLYDAMNKGMVQATGDYFWFINSGDEIVGSDTLAEVFKSNSLADIFYGETVIVNEDGMELGLRRLSPPAKLTWKDLKRGMLVSHQSVIVHRRICGSYNLKYRFSADYDWLLSALRKSNRVINTQMVLSRFLDGGLTKKNILPGLRERFQIMVQNYGTISTIIHHVPISLKFIYYFVKHKRF